MNIMHTVCIQNCARAEFVCANIARRLVRCSKFRSTDIWMLTTRWTILDARDTRMCLRQTPLLLFAIRLTGSMELSGVRETIPLIEHKCGSALGWVHLNDTKRHQSGIQNRRILSFDFQWKYKLRRHNFGCNEERHILDGMKNKTQFLEFIVSGCLLLLIANNCNLNRMTEWKLNWLVQIAKIQTN